ncbi:hypothetical protein GQR58_001063 [Nymphon striatum]|nr:hypothetical protein GQR58_001063 [Nymphon striatum]
MSNKWRISTYFDSSSKGSETVQESLKETFDTEKKLQENAKRELTQKCQRLTEDVKKLNEKLKENLNEFQEKLGDSAKNLSHNLEEMEKLKEENEQMVKKVKVIEDERKSLETQKYKAQIKTLEESKEELENELLEVKDEVNMIFHTSKFEAATDNYEKSRLEVGLSTNFLFFNEKYNIFCVKNKILKTFRENCPEKKNLKKNMQVRARQSPSIPKTARLNESKSRLKNVDNRQTEVAMGWLNERTELKEKLAEFSKKYDESVKELEEMRKTIKDKEKVEKQERDQKNEITIKDEELLMTKDKLVAPNLVNSQPHYQKSVQFKILKMALRKWSITLSKTITILGLGNRFHCACASMTGLFSGNEPTAEVSKYEGNTKMWIFIKHELAYLAGAPLYRDHPTLYSNSEIKYLERDLGKERQEYDDLTAKYDLLEEDYVVVKAKLVMDKENIEISYNKLKNEHETLSSELTTVRDTLNARQDAWIKDKLDKEERLKELEAKVSRAQGWEMERLQIQDTLNQNNSLIDSYKKEEKHLKHERDNLRRQVEDQARIINELQKMTTGTNAFSGDESERLTAVRNEKEQLVQLMGEEIQTMQKQILSFQKERDSYKEKLDLAEKLLEKNKFEAKKQDQSRKNATDSEKVSELQSEIEDLEDQLASGKLEVNNLRTGYLAEKSRWNIQMAEMKTKLNQLEERNLIDGLGRSSRMIAKTKLELAWDKERSEQQRLLAESKRLISELGDKLITVETLRDKERIDAKRQLESLKQTMKGEQGDTKKKIGELHSDLNELRHAHARVRGSTESLQKGKEYDSEKEEMRIRLVQLESHHENLSNLLTEVEKLSEIAPEVLEVAKQDNTYIKPNELTPYRGRPPLIKAASADSRTTQDEFQEMLFSILQKTKELKEVQANTEPFQKPYRRTLSASDRQQPLPGMSAIFHDDDPYKKWSTSNLRPNLPHPPPSMYITPPTQRSLYRKSVSLQDQSGIDSSTSKIWISTDTSEPGSMESLAASQASSKSAIGAGDYSTMPVRPERRSSERRRRTTEVSTESINEAAGRRSRRSVKDKIKNLVSSKSVEDSSTGKSIAGAAKISASVGLGSETPEEHKRDRSLTARIRNAFKKPSSRSTSVDKDADRDSADRKSPSPAARSHRGKLEPQSSIESVTSTKSVRNLILS